MKFFYGHSHPSTDSNRAVISFWLKNMHKYWLTALRPNLPRESVVR